MKRKHTAAPRRDKRGRFISRNATSIGAIPEGARGYDPYNSADRFRSRSLGVSLVIPGRPPMPLEGIAADDAFEHDPAKNAKAAP